jgi:hypothetical protein
MAKVRRVVNKAGMKALDGIIAMGRVTGKVGWFETAEHYPDGGPPVALVAAVNEFGWPEHNIPPRLGMRATAEEKKSEWAAVSQAQAKRVAKGQTTPQQAMEVITGKAAGDVRYTIAHVTSPPLKVDTVKARLAGKKQGKVVSVSIAKPLVNTGRLLNTLTNTVETKT